jgi:hypothetical protein
MSAAFTLVDPKSVKKRNTTFLSFLGFWDLQALKLYVEF